MTIGEDIKLTTTEPKKEKASTRAEDDKEDNEILITAQGMVLPASTTEGYKVIIELPAANEGTGKHTNMKFQKLQTSSKAHKSTRSIPPSIMRT